MRQPVLFGEASHTLAKIDMGENRLAKTSRNAGCNTPVRHQRGIGITVEATGAMA